MIQKIQSKLFELATELRTDEKPTKEKIEDMDVILDTIKFLDNYKENVKILNNYRKETKENGR